MNEVKKPLPQKPKDLICNVISNVFVTPTVFHLVFQTEPAFEFKPGQFISVLIPGAGPQGRDLRRAYSIAASPEERPIHLCVRLVAEGPGTSYLSKLNPGDTFKAQAPFGEFVYKTRADRHVCWIATGTGISPFRSMALSHAFRESAPQSTLCLFGATDETELLYNELFSELDQLDWKVCLSRPSANWSGFKGRVTHYLERLGDTFPWAETDFYLCGNGAMIEEVKNFLMQGKGVKKDAVFQEVYYRPKE
jgi:NAD(P)H-flavin reductase